MPNWVYSGFIVTGEPSEVDRFRQMMFRTVVRAGKHAGPTSFVTEIFFDFGAILPMPDAVRRRDPENWADANWGTKWNALDTAITFEAEGLLHFQFTTAWDFPTPVLEALAEEFPGLVFDGSAYEENDAFQLKGQFNGDRSWRLASIEAPMASPKSIYDDYDDDLPL